MDLNDAKRRVEEFGIGYFYEALPASSVEEIIRTVETFILQARQSGLGTWESRRDALRCVIEGSSDEGLDSIIKRDFGVWPDQVGGGRAFLQRLHDIVAKSIEQTLQKGR